MKINFIMIKNILMFWSSNGKKVFKSLLKRWVYKNFVYDNKILINISLWDLLKWREGGVDVLMSLMWLFWILVKLKEYWLKFWIGFISF